MHVLVTGATGFVGSAVVSELLRNGHQVTGLARSDAGAAALEAAGAGVRRGALDDLDGLRAAASAADGVIHTAYIHDFADWEGAARTDLAAVGALGGALEGSGRPLVIASGTALVAAGRPATEDDLGDPASPGGHRLRSEEAVRRLGGRGVRASAVRLPPTVHGEGDHGFVPMAIARARETGVSAFAGDGANRWAAVHRGDAARVFRLALESAPAGAALHAVGEEGVPVRDIAAAIARGLGVPERSMTPDEALGHFGWLGRFLGADLPASSARTRELLGWRPQGPGLIADLEGAGYLSGPAVTR